MQSFNDFTFDLSSSFGLVYVIPVFTNCGSIVLIVKDKIYRENMFIIQVNTFYKVFEAVGNSNFHQYSLHIISIQHDISMLDRSTCVLLFQS